MKNNDSKDTGDFKAFYWRQFSALFWMLAGMTGALTLRGLVPWLSENVSYASTLLIGGVLGIVVPNLIHFGSAGKAITQKDDPTTNLLVGAGLTLLLFLLVGLILSRVLF